jgi:molybdopterin molybdotransferase
MQGVAGCLEPRAFEAPAGFAWPKAAERLEFPRARLEPGNHGRPEVRLYPSHSSGVLSSVTWAEGLAIIPAGQTLQRGEPVKFLPLSELLT